MVESPCIRQCCLNPDDVCVGCWRTLEEVMQWSAGTDDEKLLILNLVAERKKQNAPNQPAVEPNTDKNG